MSFDISDLEEESEESDTNETEEESKIERWSGKDIDSEENDKPEWAEGFEWTGKSCPICNGEILRKRKLDYNDEGEFIEKCQNYEYICEYEYVHDFDSDD